MLDSYLSEKLEPKFTTLNENNWDLNKILIGKEGKFTSQCKMENLKPKLPNIYCQITSHLENNCDSLQPCSRVTGVSTLHHPFEAPTIFAQVPSQCKSKLKHYQKNNQMALG